MKHWILGVALGVLLGGNLIPPTALAAPAVPAKSKAVVVPTPAAETAPDAAVDEAALASMSLEDLMGLKVLVTSSSRKAEELRDATSSIYVLTGDDIRRSGLKTLPEALRLVPGLQVARQTASIWAISTRGLNATFNNKMLVLIDGRSVYSPTSSGVNWDMQDVVLEDVDRIEVIRGPGGTLWGANAVNGIINVITKNAKATQGLYASQLVGSDLLSLTEVRGGGAAGSHGYFRAWGKAVNYGVDLDAHGEPGVDAWNNQEAGFRGDWSWNKDNLAVLANGSHSRQRHQTSGLDLSTFTVKYADSIGGNDAANGTLKWVHQLSETSDVSVQAFYDWTRRVSPLAHDELRDTVDLEAQHRFRPVTGNEVIWGGNFRYLKDQLAYDPSLGVDYFVHNASAHQFSGFVQDKQTLVDERLFLTAGAKLEHDPNSRNELQPSGRLLWTPGDTTSFWAAASRAVRTPSRLDQSLILPQFPVNFFPLIVVSAIGNPDVKSEELVAYEVGTRFEPTHRVSIDLSGFFNRYHRLINIAPTDALFPYGNGYVTGGQFHNTPGGDTWGGEANVQWTPAKQVRLAAGYAAYGFNDALRVNTNTNQGATPPQHLGTFRAFVDPFPRLELNALYFYTGKMLVTGVPGFVPDQVKMDSGRVDLSATLKGIYGFDLTVGGQNLFQQAHSENLTDYYNQITQVHPTWFAQATGRF